MAIESDKLGPAVKLPQYPTVGNRTADGDHIPRCYPTLRWTIVFIGNLVVPFPLGLFIVGERGAIGVMVAVVLFY